jgi:hypothetical protein
MSKRTIKPPDSQLSLFDNPLNVLPFPTRDVDQTPASGIVREKWEAETRLLCAIDVVMWAKSEEYDTARQSYKNFARIISRDSTGVKFTPVEDKAKAPDGKMRKTDFLSNDQWLRLLQEIPGKLSGAAKQWMAQLGKERIEENDDPELGEIRAAERTRERHKAQGKPDEWIGIRQQGTATRKQFIALLYDLIRNPQVALFTNDVYRGVFGMDAQEIKKHLGLKPSQNARDNFPTIALLYTQIAEETCRIELAHLQDNEIVTEPIARHIVQVMAHEIGEQARAWASRRHSQLLDQLPTARQLRGKRQ